MFIDVLIENAFLYHQTLSYFSPHPLQPGQRVLVPLRGRELVAFVLAVDVVKPDDIEILEILDILDDKAIVNEELFELALWLAHHTVSPLIRCFQAILPNALKPQSSAKKAAQIRMLRRTALEESGLSPKQKETLDRFSSQHSYQEVRAFYGGIKKLIEKAYYEEYTIDKEALDYPVTALEEAKCLTQDQEAVYRSLDFNESASYLLFGVTGSGKTELYLQWAKDCLSLGKSALVLVPEIALTPQMIARFTRRFGNDVAFYHSGLSNQEKYEQYRKVESQKARIVVGTRSAVFMPMDEIGLIIIDEEHDQSYKQSSTPYYHAIDVAQWRSQYHNAPLVLGSASPSLESYAKAITGHYKLMELKRRINESFPTVILVDTRKGLYARQSSILSPALIDKMGEVLERKEQILLLLNRRGYMPLLKDAQSLEVLMCPNCDVALNYHKDEKAAICHQCSYRSTAIFNQNHELELIGSGIGTQRLQEMVEAIFTQARVLRMDADSTRFKNAHEKILQAFANHEADILIGTQMIAKGIDIPNVTLVGILNIDASLSYTDYRSVEDTFALLLQALGRSGRGAKRGEVMIQSFNPEHYAIDYARKGQYKHFFKKEMEYRKLAGYPPYQYLIALIFSDESEEKAEALSQFFLSLYQAGDEKIIGPARLRKLKNRYRTQILLKGRDLERMIFHTEEAVKAYYKMGKGGLVVDVNPRQIES